MNATSTVLARHIRRTFTGPMWHGPALEQVLAGVSAADARSRPVDGAHTIWEIVLHVAAWAEIACERLAGRRLGDATPDEDWPRMAEDDAEWPATVERLQASYRSLAREVRGLDDAVLETNVTGLEYTVSTLLHGVIEHGTYHGGQIALLKRAIEQQHREQRSR